MSAGTAEAEVDKRVCGNWFKSYPNNMEVVYLKFFEVRKGDKDACVIAAGNTMEIGNKWGLKWGDAKTFEMETCEWLGKWLYGKYGNDPCLNLKTTTNIYDITPTNAHGLWYDTRNPNG